MTRALVIILFVAAFGLGAWALLGIGDTAKTADQSGDAPAAHQTPPAPANPAPDQAAKRPLISTDSCCPRDSGAG
jgi:hypothetical protein